MQELKLHRPIVDFDIESTGTDPATARIVQLAVVKTMPDGQIDIRKMIIDPGVPIPKLASDIHGITDEVIAEMKLKGPVYKFADVAQAIYKFIDGCELRGYNIRNYDIPLLAEEFARAGIDFWFEGAMFPKPDVLVFDAMVIFKKKEERTLTAALKFYCDKDIENAHDALADVYAAQEVFLSQVTHYEDLNAMTPAELHEYCKMDNRVDLSGFFVRKEDGRVYFSGGKYKDQKVADVFMTKEGMSYYHWMIEKGSFTSNTLRHAREMYGMIHPPQQVQQ